ncbi:MAG: dihydroorotate dehydrogenase electron transfer subunit [Ignavibacteriales bacterium]|nr:dihydroorotate dehydrogenase electron transfer subunit [Ignavibacteriales bacterium]
MMFHLNSAVVGLKKLHNSIYCLTIRAPLIKKSVLPGQFVNLQVSKDNSPLLRRPFSIYNVCNEDILILFNVVGNGTELLSEMRVNQSIDLIGPLGNSFNITDEFETALLVGGGMGVASLPLLNAALRQRNIPVVTFVGAKNKDYLILDYLHDVNIATDDGSKGFSGNVVSLVDEYLKNNKVPNPKIFSCGPPKMLESITLLAEKYNIHCEVSVESVMACGMGICQGCPVERKGTTNKYSLVCKDGPVFDSGTLKYLNHG